MVQKYRNENVTETNRDSLEKGIIGCPNDTTRVDMEEVVNNNDGDETEITSENEFESVIHRDITE